MANQSASVPVWSAGPKTSEPPTDGCQSWGFRHVKASVCMPRRVKVSVC